MARATMRRISLIDDRRGEHGGATDVKSVSAKVPRFIGRFPTTEPGRSMIREEHTILLVEDNLDDVELTRRAFIRSNIANQLVVVHDGEEALDYLYARGRHKDRNPAALPRAVLLDLNLPKIGGLEVLRDIRATEATKHLPVIILTTSTEERDIVGSYDLGANSHIRKPVDFIQFVEAIRQLGLYWLALNEPPPRGGGQ